MKKKLLAYSVGALCVGAIAYPAWKMIKEKIAYHKDYQEQLDVIVEAIEIERWKTRADIIAWKINVSIPDDIEYEVWDEEYEIPRVLFKARKYGAPDFDLYSMGIDGKDVKLVATREDFGASILPLGYFTGPNRSLDGRYIISTSNEKGYGCTLYDIKERKGQNFALGRCYIESWLDDGKIAIINNGDGKSFLTLSSKEIKYIKDIYGYEFEDANSKFFVVKDGKKAISNIYNDNAYANTIEGSGEQIIYDMPGFKNPERGNFLSDECKFGGTFGVSSSLFTCSYDSNKLDYNVYESNNPNKIIGKSLGYRVIELGKWGMQDGEIYRIVDDSEDTPLAKIKYKYDFGDEYQFTVYDDLYLPVSAKETFEGLNIADFFPELPSKARYEDTWIDLLY
ncbi:hypothetical protein L6J37_19225 [Photobacterium sp. WH77]|uniref:hypothetical protein n=1 Tax=unclassified Photobacterium TaxID=2628852 RepID=UPI001EDB426D|nr:MULTISPECIES: hypothetical protein [unclassified Photobacterium]MCG2838968.1 hypothetical protein [Photobacterium sp. WH77]MCG2846585.1 hypothetical protein [Photobacterium sp. WH80]